MSHFLHKFARICKFLSYTTQLKALIQLILGVIILVLAFLLARSIIQPIRFNREAESRMKFTVNRLQEIKKAQIAFKDINGDFASSFDTLINFINNDSFKIRKITGSYSPDEMNEVEALEAGLVNISETSISIKDSLFRDHPGLNNIRYVPDISGEEFVMNAGTLETNSGVTVDVFEVYVLYETLLQGMDSRLTQNYIVEKSRSSGFPGIKLGSMTEAVTTGNWE